MTTGRYSDASPVSSAGHGPDCELIDADDGRATDGSDLIER